jgi:hypothetical protein
MPELVLLRTASDVQALLAGKLPGHAHALVVTGLPKEEATRQMQRLAELRDECGRGIGATFALCTLVASATWTIVAPAGHEMSTGSWAVLAALAVALAGGVGRAVRLGRARRALRAEMWRLHDRLLQGAGEQASTTVGGAEAPRRESQERPAVEVAI